MLRLGKVFWNLYTPLTDEEFSWVCASPERAELFVDFVAVLHELIVPLSCESYSLSVFSEELSDKMCHKLIEEFEELEDDILQKPDNKMSTKMRQNHEFTRLLRQSKGIHVNSKFVATTADSYLEKVLGEYNRFRKFKSLHNKR